MGFAIDEVERRLTRREAKRLRKQTERAARAYERELVASDPPPRTDLPATVIEHDGVTYLVCGVAHGQRRSARPGPKIVRAAQAVAARVAEPNTAVLFESGMGRVFAVDQSLEVRISGSQVFEGLPFRDVFRIMRLLPVAMVAGPVLRLVRTPFAALLRRALNDPRWLPALRDAYYAEEPPEPLGMETMRLAGQGFHVRHSELMARAARAAAVDGVTRVHFVVGLAHLHHLEWLLAHEGVVR